MLLLALSLLCTVISAVEATVHSAGSVEERQDSAVTVCLYYNDGSSSAWCLDNEQCQVATALTPAIIFCGTLGALPPHTTENNYSPSMGCEENCCNSDQPSAYKFEISNGDSAWWGCGTIGGIITANAVEDLMTVAGTTTSASSIETKQTSLSVASPPAATSGARATSASSAKTSTTIKADNSSGLSTASEVGSVIGAISDAIAVAVAIFFGIKGLKKERQHRRSRRSRRSSDSGSETIVLSQFH